MIQFFVWLQRWLNWLKDFASRQIATTRHAFIVAKYRLMVLAFRPYRYTKGFVSYEKFNDHFEKAKSRPPYIKSQLEFASWVDGFCGGPKGPSVDDCIRPYDNARLRFDNATQMCSVLHPDGFIGSCFPSKKRFFDGQCRKLHR